MPKPAGPQWFAAITEASGIHSTHRTGTNDDMPDQTGPGIALIDFDQDGRLDVYCVRDGRGGASERNQFIHQETDGRFRDVSVDCARHVEPPGQRSLRPSSGTLSILRTRP